MSSQINGKVWDSDGSWHVMRYVAGMPRSVGRSRLLVILQAYMDESGNWGENDSDEVFVVAGFVSSAEKWQQFADNWLDNRLPIDLKMTFAMKQVKRGKVAYLEAVTSMIETAAMARVESAVHLASYRESVKGKIPKEVDNPYFWAFNAAIDRICRTALALKYKGTLDLFFDEHTIGKNSERWYDLARISMPEAYRRMLPHSIYWKNDEEFLPLKSADLLAGMCRRDHNADTSGLDSYVKRICAIPMVQDSEPLDSTYFSKIIDSPPLQLEGHEFENWKERWNEGHDRP
ncbi:MAG: DUF3800 domain-containing protein [Edaphobacter sp.]